MLGKKVFEFPPSQEFMNSPQFVRAPGGVRLEYDEETPDGPYQQRSLFFEAPLGFRYASMRAFQPWMADAYDELIEALDTEWLPSMQAGNPQFHSYKHYMVFFDDHGFDEIVAQGFSTETD